MYIILKCTILPLLTTRPLLHGVTPQSRLSLSQKDTHSPELCTLYLWICYIFIYIYIIWNSLQGGQKAFMDTLSRSYLFGTLTRNEDLCAHTHYQLMAYDMKEKPELEFTKSPLRFKMTEMPIMSRHSGRSSALQGKLCIQQQLWPQIWGLPLIAGDNNPMVVFFPSHLSSGRWSVVTIPSAVFFLDGIRNTEVTEGPGG